MRRKFDGIISLQRSFAVWPESGALSEPVPLTREQMEEEIKYKTATPIERFMYELFFRMMRNEDRVVCKAEVDLIKTKFLLSDCDNLEYEQRRSVYKTLKRILVYIGLVDLHVKVLPPADGQKSGTQIKGLKWVFQSPK